MPFQVCHAVTLCPVQEPRRIAFRWQEKRDIRCRPRNARGMSSIDVGMTVDRLVSDVQPLLRSFKRAVNIQVGE